MLDKRKFIQSLASMPKTLNTDCRVRVDQSSVNISNILVRFKDDGVTILNKDIVDYKLDDFDEAYSYLLNCLFGSRVTASSDGSALIFENSLSPFYRFAFTTDEEGQPLLDVSRFDTYEKLDYFLRQYFPVVEFKNGYSNDIVCPAVPFTFKLLWK